MFRGADQNDNTACARGLMDDSSNMITTTNMTQTQDDWWKNINNNKYTTDDEYSKKKTKIEMGNFYLKCKITLYTIYLPKFKTIHYVILFTRRFEKK